MLRRDAAEFELKTLRDRLHETAFSLYCPKCDFVFPFHEADPVDIGVEKFLAAHSSCGLIDAYLGYRFHRQFMPPVRH